MSNIVPTARYYPKLSEVITVDDLPEFLSFVQDGLNAIFDKIHYKNLQYSKSKNGDSAFYSLEIVSIRLAIPLPFDMALLLNPDLTGHDASISSFPITLEYQWEILAFLKSFNLQEFSFSLDDFYDLGLKVFRITDDQVMAHIINYFVVPINNQTTKFQQFVTDFNTFKAVNYPSSADLVLPATPSIATLIQGIKDLQIHDKKLSLLLFGLYILDTDLNVTKNKLQQFYNSIVPEGIEAYIKKLIIPKAKATLALSAAIEFPRTILKPVNSDGTNFAGTTADPNPKAKFVFAQAQLYADTESGIGYQVELGGSLFPSSFVAIGNTGILLQIDTLKIDLSKKTNIPEADADGRPADFIGVYARAISVTLPSQWFHEDATPGTATTTLRLGGYDLLIGTGGISGTIALETVASTLVSGPIHYFENKFEIHFPITVFQKNATTNVIEEVTVQNIAELKTKLYPTGAANIPPCPIKFPITVSEPNLATGVVKTFESVGPYQEYLNSFPNDNISIPADTVPTLWKKIGSDTNGFRIGFKKFDIVFKQNKVVHSDIFGSLEIKKFVYPPGTPNAGHTVHIDIEGHLNDNGDFNLTASAKPPYPIKFENVFTYNLKSVELGKQDNDFYIGTSGSLQFEGFLKDTLNLGPIEIDRLRIYSDGSIELKGGTVHLIDPIVLPLGPVHITVSAIHYGSHQKEYNGVMRKFNYFGFDGGISIDPLGIEIRGDGVKYYYCTDDLDDKPHPYLHIQTLYLDLILPANSGSVATINGWINIPEPGVSKEYAGGVTLKIPKANLAGKADIKLMPKYPAFIIDCEIEPTMPIPLGTFAIYGFRGLLGYRYVAEKEAVGLVSEVNTWYEYYKFPKRGINLQKFNGPDKTVHYNTPVSIGAGATLGTSIDEGYTFSLKAMVLLSIPSLFMIDGRATLLATRLGLDDVKDPPFFAFVAVGDDSLELGFGADYNLPSDNGNLIQLNADIQAGFFFKNQHPWYINIGTKTDPITARILTILTIKSYVMLSAKGIEAGSRGEFDFVRDYGVVSVNAHAFIEIGGRISFERPQFGAYLMAGVKASIHVLFVNLDLEVFIMFGVEAPKPFLIYGKFYFSVDVGIRIFGHTITLFSFSGDLEVVWNFNDEVDRYAINPMINAASTTPNKDLVKGVNMLSNESFELFYLDAPLTGHTFPNVDILRTIIPMDTYIDIKTDKGLLPGNANDPNSSVRRLLGGINNPPDRYMDLIPPINSIQGRTIRQVTHQYTIDSITIQFWNEHETEWLDYHPYEVLYPNDPLVSALKIGQFQKTDGQYNKIRILATTPFSYTEQGQPGWYIPEQYGITATTLFCAAVVKDPKCADFLQKIVNKKYYCSNPNQLIYSEAVAFKLLSLTYNDYVTVTDEANVFDFDLSLKFDNKNQLQIVLPQACVRVGLKLSNFASGVRIKYYAVQISPSNDQLFNVVYGNPDPNAINPNEPFEVIKTAAELHAKIDYDHADWHAVSKIELMPLFDSASSAQIDYLTEQIATITNNNNLISLGLVEGKIQDITDLENQLHNLECGKVIMNIMDFEFDPKKNVYSVLENDEPTNWNEKEWDFETEHKNPDHDFGFRLTDYGILIQSDHSIHSVKLLPVTHVNPEIGVSAIVCTPIYSVDYSGTSAKITIVNYQDYTKFNSFKMEISYASIATSDCKEDKIICELYEQIMDIYTSCFTKPKDTAIEAMGTKTACAAEILSLIKVFNEVHPPYHIIESLSTYINILNIYIQNGQEQNFETYQKAWDAIQSILEYLNKIGDCECGCNPKNYTLVHQVCWMSLEDYTYNINIPKQPAITSDAHATIDGINKYIQPIWRPDTSYQIHFVLKDKVDNGTETPFNYTYGFTTGGPVGYFHTNQKSTYGVMPLKVGQKLLKEDTTYYEVTNDGLKNALDANTYVTNANALVLEDTTGFIKDSVTGDYLIHPSSNPSKRISVVSHADNYALTSLKQYIDYDRSYPNADGNLLSAKPMFYHDDEALTTQIFLYFNKAYASNFFHKWESYKNSAILDGRLKIVIKDPLEGSEILNPPHLDYNSTITDIPQTIETWHVDENPQIPFVLSQYQNLFNSPNCIGEITTIKPKSEFVSIMAKNLKPNKLYTAIVNTVFDVNHHHNILSETLLDESREVHKFVFKTSRYRDFNEQINSFMLSQTIEGTPNQKQAIFKIEKAFSNDEINAAYATILGQPITGGFSAGVLENLNTNYQHAFDKVFEGILGFTPLDEAISTEVNVIRNLNDGNIIAILVRNPEPFNNPRFPLNVLKDTIQVMNGSIVNPDYHVLFSKDNSQAILINNAKNIVANLTIKFRYRFYNDHVIAINPLDSYPVVKEVDLNVNVLNN